jgi:hypothetical protein
VLRKESSELLKSVKPRNEIRFSFIDKTLSSTSRNVITDRSYKYFGTHPILVLKPS